MTFIIRSFVLSSLIVLLAACSTAPKKSTPMDANTASRLKAMPLPNRLPIPVEHVKTKQLNDTWGASRSRGRTHEGIDILAPKGTKVYSTTDQKPNKQTPCLAYQSGTAKKNFAVPLLFCNFVDYISIGQ